MSHAPSSQREEKEKESDLFTQSLSSLLVVSERRIHGIPPFSSNWLTDWLCVLLLLLLLASCSCYSCADVWALKEEEEEEREEGDQWAVRWLAASDVCCCLTHKDVLKGSTAVGSTAAAAAKGISKHWNWNTQSWSFLQSRAVPCRAVELSTVEHSFFWLVSQESLGPFIASPNWLLASMHTQTHTHTHCRRRRAATAAITSHYQREKEKERRKTLKGFLDATVRK